MSTQIRSQSNELNMNEIKGKRKLFYIILTGGNIFRNIELDSIQPLMEIHPSKADDLEYNNGTSRKFSVKFLT